MAQRETCSALSRICHKTLADNRAPQINSPQLLQPRL